MPLPHSAAFLTPESSDLPFPAVLDGPPLAPFEEALTEGLRRPRNKEIPSSWLYDALGSALFEAITLLPEYGLTRADERVIQRCAPQLAEHTGAGPLVVELGSGSGRKTQTILARLLEHGAVDYAPIDVSAAALEDCARQLQALHGLRVLPTLGSYLDGLQLALARRKPGQRVLLLFLGSTIGNFSRTEIPPFLRQLRSQLREGDSFLLGADLEKPAEVLELAYDDPAGVTAAFNKNLLAHLNRSFQGDFNLASFRHQAVYNAQQQRIEMYLESLCAQEVLLSDLDLRVTLAKGERIRTELSHKFRLSQLRTYAAEAGFSAVTEWVDREWPFAECLWRAAASAPATSPFAPSAAE